MTGFRILVRQGEVADVPTVSSILREAAAWLERRGDPLWKDDELRPERLTAEVAAGQYFLAERDGRDLGVLRFQLSDPIFWPDAPYADSAFIHRLAVRREAAGQGVSTLLLQWAVQRASSLGLNYLRLDTEYARPRLRAVYEQFGFRHHSDRHVGPYHVARYELALGSRRE